MLNSKKVINEHVFLVKARNDGNRSLDDLIL